MSAGFIAPLQNIWAEATLFNRRKSHASPVGVKTIVGDRSDRAAFEAAMQREKFDAVIDMICFTKENAESELRAFADVGHLVYCSTVCTF